MEENIEEQKRLDAYEDYQKLTQERDYLSAQVIIWKEECAKRRTKNATLQKQLDEITKIVSIQTNCFYKDPQELASRIIHLINNKAGDKE